MITERKKYNPKTHTGVDAVDCKAIHLALQSGECLTIDRCGHICDSHGTWIADGKERSARSTAISSATMKI